MCAREKNNKHKRVHVELCFNCVSGMLRRWDDSQKFLSDNPHLVCKETANCLVVICIDYDIDEVGQSIGHHHGVLDKTAVFTDNTIKINY